MNILYFLKNVEKNGVTTTVIRLAGELVKRGHTIGIASGGGHYLEELQRSGINHYQIPFQTFNPFATATNMILLSSVMKDFNPHLIHVQMLSTSIYAKLLERIFDVPFISTAHIVGIGKGSSIKQSLFYHLCHFGKKCIAVSSDVKQDIQERFRLADSDIVTIINGLETEYFCPPTITEKMLLRKRYDIDPNLIVVSSIGRIGWGKGFHYLIYAAERLKLKLNLPLWFLVAGDGDSKHLKFLETETVSHGVSDVFRFLGWSDPKEIYSLSDIFVLPTIQGEAFPTVVTEAMAMGLATIRTSGEAARDQIIDGFNGLIVQKRDVEGLVNALEKCCVDESYRLQLAQNARTTALENFSIQRMVDEYIRVYSQFDA